MTMLFEILLSFGVLYLFVNNNSRSNYTYIYLFSVLFLLVLPTYYIPLHSDIIVSFDSSILDSLSFWFAFLVSIVVFASYLLITSFNESMTFILFLLFIACYIVFKSSDLLLLYVSYEFSLVPILYIIVKAGSYPDRSISASYIFLYTAVFSFPLIVYVVYSLLDLGTFSFLPLGASWGGSSHILTLAFMAFLVKLPVYGLHFWLPIAHVEAPTYGSIILAGLLLKIGGCGLFRVSVYSSFSGFNSVWISYLVISILFSSIVCCVQSDFKRLVAYSSVAHIIVVIIALILSVNLGVDSFLIIMLAHGISSPMLFMLVGICYSLYGTRMLLLYRGLLSAFPLMSLFIVLCFVLSVPVPPSISFLGEVQLVISLLSYASWLVPLVIGFVFLAVVYNLFWLNSLFGPADFPIFSGTSFYVAFRDYTVLFFLVIQSFFILFLFL